MNSREQILKQLRSARQPFTDVEPIADKRPVIAQQDNEDLLTIFIERAEELQCQVQTSETEQDAVDHILKVLGDHSTVSAWDFQHIPLTGLENALQQASIDIKPAREQNVQIGITGAVVGLAATGSIVIGSGAGRGREVSLLPYTHIAVLKRADIVRDLETWLAQQRQDLPQLQAVSKYNIISGPSRTADIAMQLVLGAHGPAELYIVII